MKLVRSAVLAGFILTALSQTSAQLVSGHFTTSFYTWRKFDTVATANTYLRAFQTVQLSAAQGDFSLHTFLQGAMNATNSFGDVGRVRVYNLYLTWANIAQSVDLNVGRQSLYAGVAYGTIDGALARARVWDNAVTITGFAGATVDPNFTRVGKDIHDNYSVGGQVVTTAVSDARIGVSYMSRHEKRDPYWALRARDSTFTPVLFYINNSPDAEQYGSLDASYTWGTLASFYGRYDYDFNMEKTSRGQGGARFNVTDALAVTGDYIYRSPHIAYNSIFSVFASSAVSELEGGVEYGFTRRIRGFARLAVVSYTDENSHRWTIGLNAGYGSFSYSGSDGYAGQLQSLSLQGGYPILDKLLTPTLGFSYAAYRLTEQQGRRDKVLSVLVGGVVRPMAAFSFDLQGQWLNNPVYKRDIRLQAKATYWFSEKLSLFGEEAGR